VRGGYPLFDFEECSCFVLLWLICGGADCSDQQAASLCGPAPVLFLRKSVEHRALLVWNFNV
jgi:hypothetical protein